MVAYLPRGVYTNPPAKWLNTMRNRGLAPSYKVDGESMATYKLTRQTDGQWRVWARHKAHKGAPVKSHVSTVPREGIPDAVTEAHLWAVGQRGRGE